MSFIIRFWNLTTSLHLDTCTLPGWLPFLAERLPVVHGKAELPESLSPSLRKDWNSFLNLSLVYPLFTSEWLYWLTYILNCGNIYSWKKGERHIIWAHIPLSAFVTIKYFIGNIFYTCYLKFITFYLSSTT